MIDSANAGPVLSQLRGVIHINVDYAKTSTNEDLRANGVHCESFMTGDEDVDGVAHAAIQQAVTEMREQIVARAARIVAELAVGMRVAIGKKAEKRDKVFGE